MRIKHTVSSILTFAALGHTLNSVCASGSGSGSGDEPWNYYGGDDNFYAFSEYGDAAMHWSEYSIYPEACITRFVLACVMTVFVRLRLCLTIN